MKKINKKEKIEWRGVDSLNREEQLALCGAVENAVISLNTISEEKENVKEIKNEIKEMTGIPPKVFNFLCKVKIEENEKHKLQEESEALVNDADNFLFVLEQMKV